MNPVAELTASVRGWAEIVSGKAAGAEQFRSDRMGLVIALLTLVIAILLSAAAQAIVVGQPPTAQVVFGLAAQGITIGLLALAIAQTLRWLKRDIPLNRLLVPIVYALSYMFVLSIVLALLGPNGGLIAIAALAVLIVRAGQVLAGMNIGIAIAFALLCVIVLVVVPNALYMLLSLFPSA